MPASLVYPGPMLVLALAAAAAAPQPGALKTFKDWIVGCDNGRACQAVSLLPEATLEGPGLVLKRGPQASAPVQASIALRGGEPGTIELGARRARLGLKGTVAPADLPALLDALRSRPALQVRDRRGRPSGTISLQGASAALLYMDEQQRRAGTAAALVRPGKRPASATPAPPPLPVLERPLASGFVPAQVDRAALLRAHSDRGCGQAAGPEDVETYRLDRTHTLVLVPDRCGSGAYNAFATALIADDRGRARPARFDARTGMGPDPSPTVVNPAWDAAERVLTSFAKGRGLGDCGVIQRFGWAGEGFRLIEQSEMGECRGSTDYITTWHAAVRQLRR